jgi:hypothetical protein
MDTHVKAARAKQILEDEVFKEALNVVLSAQVGVFQSLSSSEEEIMEAHRMVRALTLLKGQLQSFVSDSKLLEQRQNKARHRG